MHPLPLSGYLQTTLRNRTTLIRQLHKCKLSQADKPRWEGCRRAAVPVPAAAPAPLGAATSHHAPAQQAHVARSLHFCGTNPASGGHCPVLSATVPHMTPSQPMQANLRMWHVVASVSVGHGELGQPSMKRAKERALEKSCSGPTLRHRRAGGASVQESLNPNPCLLLQGRRSSTERAGSLSTPNARSCMHMQPSLRRDHS